MKISIKTPLLSAILLFSIPSFSQDFLGENQETILEHYRNIKADAAEDPYSNYQITLLDSSETIAYKISGHERIDLTFHMSNTDDNPSAVACERIVQVVHCQECMDSHIRYFLGQKSRKWRKVDDDEYIAGVWTSKTIGSDEIEMVSFAKLIVEQTRSQMTVTLSEDTMELVSWKEIIKKNKRYR